eukprot:221212_1
MFKKPPISVDELISRMKEVGISNDDVEKFQNWIDDNGFEYDGVKEEIGIDKEESMLIDCFRDELKDERIFDMVKGIMDNTIIFTKAVDYMLGKYYETCGINDYYDGNNIGKFSLFLN